MNIISFIIIFFGVFFPNCFPQKNFFSSRPRLASTPLPLSECILLTQSGLPPHIAPSHHIMGSFKQKEPFLKEQNPTQKTQISLNLSHFQPVASLVKISARISIKTITPQAQTIQIFSTRTMRCHPKMIQSLSQTCLIPLH